MFLESKDFLTIWDTAHRWAGYDAETTDPNALPGEVRYWIHNLILGYLSKDLVFRRKNGYRVPEGAIFIFFVDINIWQHGLWKCLTKDVFNKPFLNSLYVMRGQIIRWCEKERHPLPHFWIEEKTDTAPETKPTINNRSKDEMLDRFTCQAIARVYWDIDQQIHPAHLAKSKAIQQYGNGRHYTEDTIKGWIAEVDPVKNRKTGRPKEISYAIDLETGGLPRI